jgi:hypothetical protein
MCHTEQTLQPMCFPGSSIVLSVLAGEDGGDVLGADAMKVQVKAAGKFTPGRSG